MDKVDWKDAPEWADRLMKSRDGDYLWCSVVQCMSVWRHTHIVSFSVGGVTIGDFELIEMRPDKWKEGEKRIEPIVQNGNDGEHYAEIQILEDKALDDELRFRVIDSLISNKSKYHREIKKGVLVDVYDVLSAFEVINPAMQHALKKMLAPGKRGAKDAIQDMKEAIQSIERAIELEEDKG